MNPAYIYICCLAFVASSYGYRPVSQVKCCTGSRSASCSEFGKGFVHLPTTFPLVRHGVALRTSKGAAYASLESESFPRSFISKLKSFGRKNKMQLTSIWAKAVHGALHLKKSLEMKSVMRAIIPTAAVLFATARRAAASAVGAAPIKSDLTPAQGVAVWGFLFVLSATLHSAESAITKLSHWKVQQFADEEGPTSPFATLSSDITRLLSTILLTTTACSIYSTALFVATAEEIFPKASLGTITAALTGITLFFGELLPKALAVANAEIVARKTVPIISRMSSLLSPLIVTVTYLSDFVLRLTGMRSEEDRNVSENMLRLVVDEAERSEEGIDNAEGRMIKAVLDMQDTEVSKIMQPRVDIIGVPETATAAEVLQLVVSSKYSRIPVYRGDIDNIVGVVFSKDLLEFMYLGPGELPSASGAAAAATTGGAPSAQRQLRMASDWSNLNATQIMDPTFFVPETMTAWNALQEMRIRRVHMAIVVDEYGGTAGLVTFEDILEEVVGEIYDEDDDEEEAVDSQTIFRKADGSFDVKGFAELDDVCEALDLSLDEEALDEYSTIGGYLLSRIGAIPSPGTVVKVSDYIFTIREIEDNRRILSMTAAPIVSKGVQLVSSTGGENAVFEDKGESLSEPVPVQFTQSLSSHDDRVPAAESDIAKPAPVPPLEPTVVFRDGHWVEVPSTASTHV